MKSLKQMSNAELWQRWKDTFDALGDPLEDAKALDKVEDEVIRRMKHAREQAAQQNK